MICASCARALLSQNTAGAPVAFARRTQWLLQNRPERARWVTEDDGRLLLSLVTPEQLQRVLGRVLDSVLRAPRDGMRAVGGAPHPGRFFAA